MRSFQDKYQREESKNPICKYRDLLLGTSCAMPFHSPFRSAPPCSVPRFVQSLAVRFFFSVVRSVLIYPFCSPFRSPFNPYPPFPVPFSVPFCSAPFRSPFRPAPPPIPLRSWFHVLRPHSVLRFVQSLPFCSPFRPPRSLLRSVPHVHFSVPSCKPPVASQFHPPFPPYPFRSSFRPDIPSAVPFSFCPASSILRSVADLTFCYVLRSAHLTVLFSVPFIAPSLPVPLRSSFLCLASCTPFRPPLPFRSPFLSETVPFGSSFRNASSFCPPFRSVVPS